MKHKDDISSSHILTLERRLLSLPSAELPREGMPAHVASRIIRERMLDRGPSLHDTSIGAPAPEMEPAACRLMAELLHREMSDDSPRAPEHELERRCVHILAGLWNAPDPSKAVGYAAGGAEQAAIAGGAAALLSWRRRRRAVERSCERPNFVVSAAGNRIWRRFAELFDLEMRVVPLYPGAATLDPARAAALCDERTTMVVATAGSPLTGLIDDILLLDGQLERLDRRTGWSIPIHVDAAFTGLLLPFRDSRPAWDFRLRWVHSVSTAGDRSGLVCPGLGWTVWRDADLLPADIKGDGRRFAPPFTCRPAGQPVLQLYHFLRLGRNGYRRIAENRFALCRYLCDRLTELGFRLLADPMPTPAAVFYLPERSLRHWTLPDLARHMRPLGWRIPVRRLPGHLHRTQVMQIEVGPDTGFERIERLLTDLEYAVSHLDREEPRHPFSPAGTGLEKEADDGSPLSAGTFRPAADRTGADDEEPAPFDRRPKIRRAARSFLHRKR